MGALDWLFKSDKDKQVGTLEGMRGSNEGVVTLDDMIKKFGASKFDTAGYQRKVGDVFAPKKQALGNALARNRSSIARRMTGNETQPASMYSSAEGDYYNALGGLESAQAGEEVAGYDKEMNQNNWLANFFQNVLSGKDQFNQWKKGMQVQNADDSSLFNDITGVASTVAKFIPGPTQALGFLGGGGGSSSGGGFTSSLEEQIAKIRNKGNRF